MQDDEAARDAATLLASLARNHPEAMRGTAFALSEDEPRLARLNQDRFDDAMQWLIKYGFVEREEEEAERLRGLEFRITERGRKPLREAGPDEPS
jgi:hypothetical protein